MAFYQFEKKSISFHLIIVLVLTFLMYLDGSVLFYISDLLPHPQFRAFELFYSLRKQALLLNASYYIVFFLLDFVWAPLLLWLLFRWMKGWESTPGYFIRIYPIIAVFSYLFDFFENTIYLLGYVSGDVLKVVVEVKIYLYVTVFLFFILSAILKLVKR